MALTPGERISLIKGISGSLAAESWTDISLTLDLFGIPEFDDQWTDDYDYISRRLRQTGDDGALLGLYAHLYPDATVEDATSDAAPGPWGEGFFRLFLSHTKASKQLAGKIRERLLEQGIDAYVAHDLIEPTKEWMDEIETALRTCDATAAILSEDFVGSQWCDQEIGISIGRRILIIAVRQGADPHGFISKFQAVPGDATPLAPENIATNLRETLVSHDLTKAKMAAATVQVYANSGSFDDARANLTRVREIPKPLWTNEMIDLAEKAGEENVDLRHGDWYGTPIPQVLSEYLDQLLDRPEAASANAGADDDIPF
ncbi:MAG TPA: toll/interleukin-1 receptor domain-containing protein [Solirubrobacterales bacterium]